MDSACSMSCPNARSSSAWGISRRIGEIARTITRLVGATGIEPEITGEFRLGDIRHCTADTTKAAELMGFSPLVDWEESLGEIIEWSRSEKLVETDRKRAHEELERRGLVH
jgi:dTDP-L-rhamnose 4-epimerase